MHKADFFIIGGGVIGINVAIDLKKRYPDASVVLIEKELNFGAHASGKNSGVLHAGFYYTKDSLKSKYTRDGNSYLKEYCREKNIPINEVGKLVVTKNENDLEGLNELFRRGKENGIELIEVTEEEARQIEPKVKTLHKALFSPTTATVDPKKILKALLDDAKKLGITIHTGVRYIKKQVNIVITSQGPYDVGYLVNTAGLYADKIAKDYGFSENYAILPFKGLYLYSTYNSEPLNTNIYPVPELNKPFLGVHFTITVDGVTKIGPTAIPALWREQYTATSNFKVGELIEIAYRGLGLLTNSEFDFGKLAINEFMKYRRSKMLSLASSLLRDGITNNKNWKWGKPGIRAQLIDTSKKKLEMDFVVEGDNKSMHVLNAVSPAFTCSIPFSRFVGEKIHNTLHG